MSLVTCHTEGCGNAGHAIPVSLEQTDPDTLEVSRTTQVVCGVCGVEIVDITDD